jgi:uncharacterized membrane protein
MKFVQEFFCIIHSVTSNFHMGFLFKLWNNFDNLPEDLLRLRFSYMKFVQEFFCIIHPVTSNFHMGFLFKLWNNFDTLPEDLLRIRFSCKKFVQEFLCIIHPVTSNFHMGFLFKLWNNFDNLPEDLLNWERREMDDKIFAHSIAAPCTLFVTCLIRWLTVVPEFLRGWMSNFRIFSCTRKWSWP